MGQMSLVLLSACLSVSSKVDLEGAGKRMGVKGAGSEPESGCERLREDTENPVGSGSVRKSLVSAVELGMPLVIPSCRC